MTDTLTTALTAPEVRPAVVADIAALVDSEVSGLGGISGIAIKGAYAAAKKRSSTAVSRGIDSELDTILGVLQPHWDAYRANGGASFGAYLQAHDGVADEILSVAEAQAKARGAEKMYGPFAGQARKILVGALPGLGDIVEKHAA
ncbi:conserved hypothetical protein [Beutenbergia cavernae DSM 12333]|uniref:Uncharacterized protein n=1 Tax=Beutenbergia cavernae (strain ATCC BAA-8 / DSM 12333 / CCUG 43141 / JCM 11478 / NBRC 16432 / NCIMB 13614 / HKI 0122) TaxID=471853 RepID=C5BYJ8_BEUC1|nr:hypothetical protein [Beutenbergia cavernae]ACQ78956.1 conserved hypothetical protein [Beutenbergia cavernae DSM 12333]